MKHSAAYWGEHQPKIKAALEPHGIHVYRLQAPEPRDGHERAIFETRIANRAHQMMVRTRKAAAAERFGYDLTIKLSRPNATEFHGSPISLYMQAWSNSKNQFAKWIVVQVPEVVNWIRENKEELLRLKWFGVSKAGNRSSDQFLWVRASAIPRELIVAENI